MLVYSSRGGREWDSHTLHEPVCMLGRIQHAVRCCPAGDPGIDRCPLPRIDLRAHPIEDMLSHCEGENRRLRIGLVDGSLSGRAVF
jgi:hypothetical protein